jgi:hypothetical protein
MFRLKITTVMENWEAHFIVFLRGQDGPNLHRWSRSHLASTIKSGPGLQPLSWWPAWRQLVGGLVAILGGWVTDLQAQARRPALQLLLDGRVTVLGGLSLNRIFYLKDYLQPLLKMFQKYET